MGNRAKDWWRENGDTWLKQTDHWSRNRRGHFFQEQEFMLSKLLYLPKEYKILEVGAGNGRLIGRISEAGYDCSSIDISPELSLYVGDKYPKVEPHIGEITELPFRANEFDLVYTHEVLQHIEPDEIEKACAELLRVSKNEVWNLESYRDYEVGKKVSGAHNGRWTWDLKKYLPVAETFYTDWGQMFYKSIKEQK